ncbi:hypothetical protein D9756_008585 [Leucocoprinus leucothites]|uniref:Uncharacterized protein n=1 Tax=Leucocoprinus leucothites TaxID=201217 RepID=A0A8H5FVA2_9AGAR|nr:hypothetical protein D9756_008585 [Leucoagaricus leucothites]
MRPPPLQLKIDNRLPEVHAVREEARSFWEKLYRSNWRNVVLVVSGINTLRFTLSALDAYHDVDVDNSLNFSHLAGVSSFLCSMYLIRGLIDIFGILSLAMRRAIFTRIYAFLAVFSALVVVVAGGVASLTFHIFAADLIQECIALAMTGDLTSKSIFRGRPWPLTQHSLSSREASQACQAAWTSEGSSQTIAIFVFSLLPSTIYCLVVYNYYRQVIDPTHSAYLNETQPYSAIRMETWPLDSPLYNGTPVATVMPKRKPQERKKILKQPPLMKSSSPMEYMMTPGPPSFGPPREQGYEPYMHASESASNNLGYWVDKRR